MIPLGIHGTGWRVFIVHILANEKTLAHISLLMLPRMEEADTIDGFLKIFRLETIESRDHSHSPPICIHK